MTKTILLTIVLMGLLGALLFAAAFVVGIGRGGQSYSTYFGLERHITAEELSALKSTTGKKYQSHCTKEAQSGECVRWTVGDFGRDGASIKLIRRDGKDYVVLTSLPYYPLYFGSPRVRNVHKDLDSLIAGALGENLQSIDYSELFGKNPEGQHR
ncbi:hypothetical protein [Aliiroseovarius crassostreae]|uniref:hypothetical protein n=1 Tax=Aliiroseovarius crassostreae TaxID=154981 RepID=UPI00220A3976|nr:hypothetical protein [Aliiroseovarius crassostreae]UWP89905.1 hypothetical protein K3J57_04235 [Aliiroseovarius crassostreae]UWQ02554.1 hypothetical protein K3X44_04240 [Aliiroseovarius crassostreae]